MSKMLEGEREKLLRMEEGLQARVVGQGEAVKVVSDCLLYTSPSPRDLN